MASTLLRLKDTSGNMQVMTSAEELYVAYKVAESLAAAYATSDAGSLTIGAGDWSIGNYVNTFFNENVGTHPGTSITSGSTTTTFRQVSSATVPTGIRPVTWDGTATGIKELTDAEMNTVADRLLSHMMLNEWAGVNFRVSSTTPTGYSSHQASVVSDTQSGNGAVTNYSIFRKTTLPTAPTTSRPMCIKYNGSAFEGVREMTDTEIVTVFSAWIKYRMAVSNSGIGSYLLLPSGQTPSGNGFAGTWASRGAIVDTKDTTTEVDYSQNYVGTYTRNRLQDFVGDFLGNYVGIVDYSRNRTANYTRISLRDFTRISTRTRTRISMDFGRPNYTGNFVGNYLGNYIGNFLGDYVGDFIGNYTRDVGFTRNRATTFTGDFIGNYLGDYIGNYIGTTISSTDTTVQTYTLYTRTA